MLLHFINECPHSNHRWRQSSLQFLLRSEECFHTLQKTGGRNHKFNGKCYNTNGLTIKAKTDQNQFEKGLKVDDEALKKINLTNKKFRGDWNYKISP